MRLVKEHLNWETKSELKAEVLHGIKEIGSVLYWMGLLDIVLVGNLVRLYIYFTCFQHNWKTEYICIFQDNII